MGIQRGSIKKKIENGEKAFYSAYMTMSGIVGDYNNICEAIKNTYHAMKEEKVNFLLSEMDIEEINRNKEGIRVRALKDAGYTNIFQLKGIDVNAVSKIKGIGEDNADKIVSNFGRLYSNAMGMVAVKLDYDKRDAKSDELIKLLYVGSKSKILVDDVAAFANSNKEDLLDRVKKFKHETTLFSFFTMGRTRKEELSQDIDAFCEYISGSYAAKAAGYRQIFDDVRNVDFGACWKDFLENAAAYYTYLESIVGHRMIDTSDANKSALPSELVAEIESTELDLSFFHAELRSYQLFGTKYIIHQKRTLLGDEMGLGKTIQAIAAIAHLAKQGKECFLIVCPLSVLINWRRELERFTGLSVIDIYAEDCDMEYSQWKNEHKIGVTTYETLKKMDFTDVDKIDMLVVDEAHYIKNPKAIRTQNVKKLTDISEYVLYMTGTPLENSVDEMKQLIGSLNEEYVDLLKDVDNMSSAINFRRAVAPVYLRRVREDVLKELPQLIEMQDWLVMNDVEEEAYINSLINESFMSVRRVSWNVLNLNYSSKASRLVEICEEAGAQGRKVIVFSYFRYTLNFVSGVLGDKCIGQITGDISSDKRQQMVDEFSRSSEGSVLACQVEAGGVGLNIQTASIVIFCEPQFKPSIENQAISRAYRMGQARNVVVHRLLMTNTIDEGIMQILKEKQEIFDKFADESVIGTEEMKVSENAAMKKLVEDELIRLGIERDKKD